MRCFLVMMDETRRVILDSGGEGGDERVGEERGGSGDFLGGEHGWLCCGLRSHVLGACWTTVAAQVVCVFCAHNDVVCVVR